jgi:hypothetical protein
LILHDRENLSLEARLPLGAFLALLSAGLDGSSLGTVDLPPHVQTGWNVGLQTPGEPWRGEFQLRGDYLFQPDDNQDALYQAARVSLTYDPSIRWGITSAVEGGWEYWPEYPMAGEERRQDILLRAETGLEGLLGYFLDWSLLGYGGVRLSNLNGSADGQSSWFLAGETDLSWSPHRRVSLQLGGFTRYESWLEREALSSGGTPTGEALYVLSLGLDGRADWTPNGKVFLVLEGSAARRLANDPAEERWNLSAALGLEYSF